MRFFFKKKKKIKSQVQVQPQPILLSYLPFFQVNYILKLYVKSDRISVFHNSFFPQYGLLQLENFGNSLEKLENHVKNSTEILHNSCESNTNLELLMVSLCL